MRTPSTIYRVVRTADGVCLSRYNDAEQITPRRVKPFWDKVYDFDFGHATPGAYQLAFSILLDFTRQPEIAMDRYEDFAAHHVALWADQSHNLAGADLMQFLMATDRPETAEEKEVANA